MSNRKADAVGLIYFVQMDGGSNQIKIGFTTHIGRRLTALRLGCPYRIEVLGTCSGTRADEAAYHERFKADHIRGEWFRSSEELVRYAVSLGEIPPKEEPITYRFINARGPV